MTNVDVPMGNAELRITLQEIHAEVAETKGIAMEGRDASKTTNGKVAEITAWKEQVNGGIKVAIPALTLVVAALGWLTVDYLNHRDKVPVDQIQAAVDRAFNDNLNLK